MQGEYLSWIVDDSRSVCFGIMTSILAARTALARRKESARNGVRDIRRGHGRSCGKLISNLNVFYAYREAVILLLAVNHQWHEHPKRLSFVVRDLLRWGKQRRVLPFVHN